MAVEAAAIQVTLPAMGESVTEGTILEWHKQVGDTIEADEIIVEVSTDKVDAEVPAPASGTIVAIHFAEGDTVLHYPSSTLRDGQADLEAYFAAPSADTTFQERYVTVRHGRYVLPIRADGSMP